MIEAIISEMSKSFPAHLRELSGKLAAYLANPATERILLKPVKVGTTLPRTLPHQPQL